MMKTGDFSFVFWLLGMKKYFPVMVFSGVKTISSALMTIISAVKLIARIVYLVVDGLKAGKYVANFALLVKKV